MQTGNSMFRLKTGIKTQKSCYGNNTGKTCKHTSICPLLLCKNHMAENLSCLWSQIRLNCFSDIIVAPSALHRIFIFNNISLTTSTFVIHSINYLLLRSAHTLLSVFNSTNSHILMPSQTRSLASSFRYKSFITYP